MTSQEAKQIIDALAHGIDPTTGEPLPEKGALHRPYVIRALFIAGQALESMIAKPGHLNADVPNNAGKPWSEDEDQRLLAGFDAGTAIATLARDHHRSSGAINSRLVRLGHLQVRSPDTAHPSDKRSS